MIPRQSRGNLKSEPLKAAELGAAHERPSERPEGRVSYQSWS